MAKTNPPEYTAEELAAMALGDDYRGRILRRTGLKREELSCPREKSDMTPCVARDGGLAVAFRSVTPVCVGCDWSLKALIAKEEAQANSSATTQSDTSTTEK